jgi:hypothetical protein
VDLHSAKLAARNRLGYDATGWGPEVVYLRKKTWLIGPKQRGSPTTLTGERAEQHLQCSGYQWVRSP